MSEQKSNTCFSLISKDDNRSLEYEQQRLERGFDDSETWSLRDTIGNFIIPRLTRYKEIVKKHCNTDDVFIKDIDKSLRAFELLTRDNGSFNLTVDERKEYEKGMKAFHKIFLKLWW
jgi:hypothetical protein